ncbi:type II toxin-antitoxin system death-on-curing family toxin [Anaeromyxobacter oryzae]|uniref:type II toxin-antitoxin system death-on-curing family toxin n=1 Tax=Anaeromyxobacter oryzae TaxID=2918170 RepID=UPI0020BFE669|nr:Fic family protein [Anaeromyxobacter oryzae]
MTEARLEDLHEASLQKHGGDPGTLKVGCVNASLGAAWNAQAYLGEDDSTQKLLFAAHLLYYLARNHCYVDGNKRIAWLAATEVLAAMDLTVDATVDEAEAFVTLVVEGTADQSAVLEWVAERLAAAFAVRPQ